MNVELLVVPDCPNEAFALDAVREAARQAEITDLQVTVTVIDTEQAAVVRQFIGSPSFLVNGLDPFIVAAGPAGVSCRIYATPHGLSGVPDSAALRDALLRADANPASEAGDR